ncbi:hypothetical protein EJ08DRAFT_500250 [Tothia fuscella]|uniref:Uncharacterized protein n=1 Tax=Tothia fuscella TaxID=1048955 RepID=A0A9P4U290_9PEZI|nr:hypothetical protein EJ08DRAFT_500250 [Tothia fuscella]
MTDANGSTPQSSNDANGPKIAKDRNCPFCGQAFTSSSLGRHLDLYIKPKNAKPEDGIHNVEEIKRMRGNITRRQSRISGGGKRDSSTPAPSSVAGSVAGRGGNDGANATVRQILENAATQQAKSPSMVTQFGKEGTGIRINKLGWESTGVINDLPPRLEPRPEGRRDMPRHQLLKSDLDQRQKVAEELENGRAAELALQEVLGSVRDASTWYSGRGLFEFDFFALNFPTLCLRILPAPTTIFSPTPFPTPDSWSIDPPTQIQYDALIRTVEDRGRVAHKQWQARPSSTASDTTAQLPQELSNLTRIYTHITEAFNHWDGLSDEQRRETWQLETLRNYTRAEEERKEAQNAITSLRRQIDHLSQSLERANAAWPGANPQQFSQYSPLTSLRLSNEQMQELCKQGVDFSGWDYARLIDKWKLILREERNSANGLGGQRALPDISQPPR